MHTAMCMENGEWEPDPREMNCRGNESTYIVKSTSNADITLMTPRVQTGTANVIAVTIITVYVVSLIVFLAIGYTCGWFSHRHNCKQVRTNKAMSDSAKNVCYSINDEGSQLPQTSGPLYEELQLNPTPECWELVNLNKNAAYGPIVK